MRSGKFPYPQLEREVLPSLAALNGPAMAAALSFELHACTDITGFGILGHLLEMAVGSNTCFRLRYADLPFYNGALEMYQKGESTGSNKPNRALVARHPLEMRATLSRAAEELLYDPQTSGGLVLAVPQRQAAELVAALHGAGIAAAVRIGSVGEGPARIVVEG